MALPASQSLPGKRQSNLTAAARNGTVVTASGTIHTKGAYTELIASTDDASYGVWVLAMNVAAGATATAMLLDVAIGAAASEVVILPDLDVGRAVGSTNVVGGNLYWFPVFIPAGSRVAARCQALIASDTVQVIVYLDQRPLYPPPCGGVVAYGIDAANSRGTSVPKGAGVFGAWTQITASTSRDHTLWQPGLDGLADTTLTAEAGLILELGIGAAAAEQALGQWSFGEASSEEMFGSFPVFPIYVPVPSGTRLAARLAGAAAESRGVAIYGVD